MLIYLDLDTNRLVIGPGNAGLVGGYATPRGSGPLLRVQPVSGGQLVALPAGFEMTWTVKAEDDWGGDILAYAEDFTQEAGTTVYSCAVNYETTALDALLGIGGTEVESVSLIAQLAWRPSSSDTWRPTQLVDLHLHNSVWRGVPGAPAVPDTRLEFIKRWCWPKLWQINWPADGTNAAGGFYTATVTGTGQINTNGFAVLAQTGATANSRANARLLGIFEGMGFAASDSGGWRDLDWSAPLVITFSISIFAATAAGTVWLKIGNTSATAGDLASAGIQVRVENLNLYFGAHNGTTLDESAAQPLSAISRQHDISFIGDGSGNFACYLDGILIDTLVGPAAPIDFGTRPAVEAFNDTDSANAAIWCSPLKIGVLPDLP